MRQHLRLNNQWSQNGKNSIKNKKSPKCEEGEKLNKLSRYLTLLQKAITVKKIHYVLSFPYYTLLVFSPYNECNVCPLTSYAVCPPPSLMYLLVSLMHCLSPLYTIHTPLYTPFISVPAAPSCMLSIRPFTYCPSPPLEYCPFPLVNCPNMGKGHRHRIEIVTGQKMLIIILGQNLGQTSALMHIRTDTYTYGCTSARESPV